MVLNARSTGKLLLFGEHSVLYKYPALGLGLSSGIELNLDTEVPELILDIQDKYRITVLALFNRISSFMGLPLPHGRLTIKSDIPPACGFGSSAALCVAVARLTKMASSTYPGNLSMAKHEELDIWRAAHEGEKAFHGTPSGIDTALSTSGGFLRFDPNEEFPPRITAMKRSNSVPVVYGAVPRQADCAGHISSIAAAMIRGDNSTRIAIDTLGNISSEACSLLQKAQVAPIMDIAILATHAMEELRRLKLTTHDLETILETGLSNGALGGKLSGGGGGGAYWLVCPDKSTAIQASQAINKVANKLRIPIEMYSSFILI